MIDYTMAIDTDRRLTDRYVPDPDEDFGIPDIVPEPEQPREAFVIDSEDRANWYLRKRANIAAEIARVERQAAAIIADLKKDDEKLQSQFEHQLEVWARDEMQRRRIKGRTLDLLQGSCVFRVVPASMRVADKGAAMAYARENYPDLIVVTESLNGAAYNKEARAALQDTGELLPGVERTPPRETFNVVFNALAVPSERRTAGDADDE